MSTNLSNIPSLNTELSNGDGVIVGVVVEYNKSSVWTKTLSLLRNSPLCPSLFPSWLLFTPLLLLATAFLFFALYLKQTAELAAHTEQKTLQASHLYCHCIKWAILLDLLHHSGKHCLTSQSSITTTSQCRACQHMNKGTLLPSKRFLGASKDLRTF